MEVPISPTGSEHTVPDLDLDRMDSNVRGFLPLFVLYAERGCEGGWLRVGCELILRRPSVEHLGDCILRTSTFQL